MDRNGRTPRRGSFTSSAAGASTPGAGEVNIVSRVAVSATADRAGVARGILCVKLAIPRDAVGAKWPLFSGPTPTLLSIPALYPLPVTPYLLNRGSSNLLAAVTLLNLPSKSSSVPTTTATADADVPPRLEPTPEGQIFVVAQDHYPGRRRGGRSSLGSAAEAAGTPSRRETGGAMRDRAEFLAIIEFQVPVEQRDEGMDASFRSVIPVPKCLDNTIKFQMLSNVDPDSEVTVIADPKVLPELRSPGGGSDLFSPRRGSKGSHLRRRYLEDGWEDGEVPGASESDDESDDEGGSWLEGRFPSTNTLKLQWSFIASLNAPPYLKVEPQWDSKCPSIAVAFEAGIPAIDGLLTLEAVIPSGWGWRELEIHGDGLLWWKSTDEDMASVPVEPEDEGDSSVSTEMPPSPSVRSRLTRVLPLDASRLEPLNADELAPLDDTDFSFNDTTTSMLVSRTPAMSLRRRPVQSAGDSSRLRQFKVTPRVPVPAGLFELEFIAPIVSSTTTGSDDEDDERRVLRIAGTLVPLPHVLVCPDAPVPIPFVRFDDPVLPTQCSIKCLGASFADMTLEDHQSDLRQQPATRLCSTAGSTVGTVAWTDSAGNTVPRRSTMPVSGVVRLVVQRNIWGVQTVLVSLSWPSRAAEVRLTFDVPSVRVLHAVSPGGRQLAHAVLPCEVDRAEVCVAGGRGSLELALEVADDTGVALPSFPQAKGELKVELAGDGWDKILVNAPRTNLKRVSDRGFIGDLAGADGAPPLIAFALPEEQAPVASARPKSKYQPWAASLVSWNVLTQLVMMWVLISLAMQVKILRTEVAFVVDETRDLRLYSFERERAAMAAAEAAGFEWEVPVPTPIPSAEPVAEPQARGEQTAKPPLQEPREPKPVSSQPSSEGYHEGYQHDYERYRASHAREASPSSPPPGPPTSRSLDTWPDDHGLGRVVFGGNTWPAWTNHPVVRGMTRTLGQVWRAFVWLFMTG